MASRIIEEDRRLTGNIRTTTKRYIEMKNDRIDTALELYNSFLKNYIFTITNDKNIQAQNIKSFFKKDKIKIVAVDGTKYEKSRRGIIAFYVLAAPLLYELDLNKIALRRIEEESIRNNVMALIPVPLSEVFLIKSQNRDEISSEVEDEDQIEDLDSNPEVNEFLATMKVGRIDTVLMKLAEVYAMYWCLENIKPDVLMMDGSLFLDYSFSNRGVDKLTLTKGKCLGFEVSNEDIIIMKSFPINSELMLPSVSFMREFLIAEVLKSSQVTINKKNMIFFSSILNQEIKITSRQLDNWKKKLSYLNFIEDQKRDTVEIKFRKTEHYTVWDKLTNLFLTVCKEGFENNNLEAFKVYFDDQNVSAYRYLGEEDIETLCRIGYILLIQKCWQTGTILFSLTKDSFVRFMVDNFLTVASPRHLGKFEFDDKLLPKVPSTDSGMMFDISLRTKDLHPPLYTIEYDPAISTIYSSYDKQESKYFLNQLQRVAQERQFLRNVVQVTETPSGRKSLVFTLDRVVYPQFDKDLMTLDVEMQGKKYRFAYNPRPTKIMEMIMSILSITSSNKHDAVFGYPDPLFEADQYVKTLGKAHLETLDIVLTELDLDEFSVSYRQMRAEGGG